jgi:hypothetical protein
LEIHPPWVDFHPLVGNPTTGWKANHDVVGILTTFSINIFFRIEVLCRKHYSTLNISSDNGRFLEGPSP